MADRKETFVMNVRYLKYARKLTDAEFGQLMRIVFTYQATGEEPDEDSLSPSFETLFDIIKADIDENNKKYADKIEKLVDAGKKSAEARKLKKEQEQVPANSTNVKNVDKGQQVPANSTNVKNVDKGQQVSANSTDMLCSDMSCSDMSCSDMSCSDMSCSDMSCSGMSCSGSNNSVRPAQETTTTADEQTPSERAYVNLIGTVTPRVKTVLSEYDLPENLKVYAIREAHDCDKKNLKYIEAILKRYVSEGVKTIEDAKKRISKGNRSSPKGNEYDYDEIERLEIARRMRKAGKDDA